MEMLKIKFKFSNFPLVQIKYKSEMEFLKLYFRNKRKYEFFKHVYKSRIYNEDIS